MSTLKATIPGHAFSKKTHRPIFLIRKGVKCPACGKYSQSRPILGKSTKLKQYEKHAQTAMIEQMGMPLIDTPVRLGFTHYYSGRQPDCTGALETIMDCLQEARVIENDSLIDIAWTKRVHVKRAEERVEIELEEAAD